MGSPSESSGGTVSEIAQQLGGIFRHLLPGVVVVGIIFAAYPNIAGQFKDFEWPKIAVLGVITFSIGNAWFLFNRYVVNQFFDWFLWCCKHKGPERTASCFSYLDDTARHVYRSLLEQPEHRIIRAHIHFRSSAIFLLWTVSEMLLWARSYHDAASAFNDHECALVFLAILLFLAGIQQMAITRKVDFLAANRPTA